MVDVPLLRLAVWVPPERMAEFEAVYRAEVVPFLRGHGFTESARRGRATVDSVFARLFEPNDPSGVDRLLATIVGDPVTKAFRQRLGTQFGTAGPDGLIRLEFGMYAMRAGPGRTVPAGPGQSHNAWHSFGVPDGLGGSTITSMVQDRAGNLWFGGGNGGGLYGYDGWHFTIYTNQSGLPAESVDAMCMDRDGVLWLGTGGGGVTRFDGRQFTTFTTADGLADNNVASILQDREGKLWVGTWSGLSRYDGHRFTTFTTEDGLADNGVGAMVEDRNGVFWFGTGAGLSRFDGDRFATYKGKDGLADERIRSIYEDREGALWFGTEAGINRYDGHRFQTFTTKDGLAGNRVSSILQDQDGNMWFGTWGAGITRYDGQAFTTFTTVDGVSDNRVSCASEDREGNLWFGTWLGGVTRYDGNHAKSFATSKWGIVYSLLEDRKGTLWAGDEANGIRRLDGGKFGILADQWKNTTIGDIVEDRKGDLWFTTAGRFSGDPGQGVVRFDGTHFTTFTTTDGLANNSVWSILEDRKDALWFGTGGGGVSRYDGQGFRNFSVRDGLAGEEVSAIAEDRQGNLWFGTAGGGVSRYDGHEFRSFATADGLAASSVLAILEDRHGSLWFGTWGGGVSRYDGGKFSTFTTKDGLADRTVISIYEDRDGNLWFGTFSGGVSRYDGLVFQTLAQPDGLSANGVFDILQRKDGTMWLGTTKGVTRYRPRRVSPPVTITGVAADRPYGAVHEIRLPTSQRYLSFEFKGNSFRTRPGQMAYVYQLVGHDQGWRWTRDEQVEYTDLPSGEYVFQVKAVDRDLNYSEAPAAVKVTIHPPYGQFALVGGLGLALVGLVFASGTAIRRRRAFLREQTARLAAQEQLNRELEEELQTAHTLQMDLMPRESPQIPGLDLAGRCIPANHVGGDLFQYFHQEGKLSIALADVTGHAMEAAIPMVMFSGVLKSQIETGGSVEGLFGRLNRSLHHAAGSRTFVCFAFGTIDTCTSTLRLSSAAFPYPYHFSAATGEIAELRVDSYPLGVRPDTRYAAIERQLSPGDYLVFCSDGIIEATDQTGAQFGYERTAATLRSGCLAGLSAEALLEVIVEEVGKFRGEVPQGDDQTVVVLRIES